MPSQVDAAGSASGSHFHDVAVRIQAVRHEARLAGEGRIVFCLRQESRSAQRHGLTRGVVEEHELDVARAALAIGGGHAAPPVEPSSLWRPMSRVLPKTRVWPFSFGSKLI